MITLDDLKQVEQANPKGLKQRISVGAIVIRADEVLLVNHKKEDSYDFWVAPGGGIVGTESQEDAVKREVWEETGLQVDVGELLYIEEFWQPEQREIKLWYLCEFLGGELDASKQEATREHIVAARFVKRAELSKLTVFPHTLTEDVWRDKNQKPVVPRYLGLREMDFY